MEKMRPLSRTPRMLMMVMTTMMPTASVTRYGSSAGRRMYLRDACRDAHRDGEDVVAEQRGGGDRGGQLAEVVRATMYAPPPLG